LFFYRNDCQELDIEYLPDATSKSNPAGVAPPLQYTNQDINCGRNNTHITKPAPSDVSNNVHSYRIDWTSGKTAYYVDDQLQTSTTSNVPTEAGSWIFNIWSNGDPGFSVGPPKNDAILKIEEVVMYYNTTA